MYKPSHLDPYLVGDTVYEYTNPSGVQGTRRFHWPRLGEEEDFIDIPNDERRGRRFTPQYHSDNERVRRVLVVFILPFVVLAVLTGILVPLIYLSSQPTFEDLAAETIAIEFVGGNVTFDSEYLPAYNNHTSAEYKNLVEKFTSEMDVIYKTSSLNDVYIRTVVHDVRLGSTIISFESIFNRAVNPNRPFRETFRTLLEEQVAMGSIGELRVIPFTLHVYNTCNLYCTNGGTLDRPNCECNCAENFLGIECREETTIKTSTTEISKTTDAPTITEMSTTTEIPTTTDAPTTTEMSTTEIPTTTDAPTTTEMSTTTEIPTTTDTPTTTEMSTTTEIPTTTDSPTTTEMSTTTEIPTTTDAPTTTEMSTTTEIPTTTYAPTTTEMSTTTEIPTTTDAPTTTEMSTTTEIPTTPVFSF